MAGVKKRSQIFIAVKLQKKGSHSFFDADRLGYKPVNRYFWAMNIAHYIDHTILKPTTSIEEIRVLCAEACEHGFAAVCVPPPFVKQSSAYLKGTSVKVATVIGFPFGYSIARAKVFETQQAIEDGAAELDVVINLIALKSNAWKYLEKEIQHIVEAAHKNGRLVKVIIESGMLTDEEIILCCKLYSSMAVDFLKTSTGYAETSATVHAVQLIRANLSPDIKIKAAGGIRTYDFARELIEAGADRLGASAGVAIVKGQEGKENY